LTQPTDNVDVIPPFLFISPWRVILDSDLVIILAIESGVNLWLQDGFQHATLGDLLAPKGARVVKDFAISVTENVGRKPPPEA
jgi:hypothetical protein